MNPIPSIWRTELWHPMLVHFPVATLLLATITGFLCIFFGNSSTRVFLKKLSLLMLWIGVITGWIAIYTGQLSYNIEVRKLCDPEVLHDHQWWGYAAIIIYTIALGFCMILKFVIKSNSWIGICILNLLLIGGAAALSYCGHLGASVVYQQGGGTYKPSANCTEFER